MTTIEVSAPGKILLSGEYAVLFGAPAIVAAANRRVRARLTPDYVDEMSKRALARFVAVMATKKHAQMRYGRVKGNLVVDSTELRKDKRKLGLGSSAAAAACAAGLVAAAKHKNLIAERDNLFTDAYLGHGEHSKSGSGVDVAASVYGGYLRYALGSARPTVETLAVPELVTRVVWTGESSDTSSFLSRMRAFQADNAGAFEAALAPLMHAASDLSDGFESGDTQTLLTGTRAYAQAMKLFGDACGLEIVEEKLEWIMKKADLHGGAAKPSGAGGGDVAIVFFENEEDAQRFQEDISFETLSIVLGAEGVRLETAASAEQRSE